MQRCRGGRNAGGAPLPNRVQTSAPRAAKKMPKFDCLCLHLLRECRRPKLWVCEEGFLLQALVILRCHTEGNETLLFIVDKSHT